MKLLNLNDVTGLERHILTLKKLFGADGHFCALSKDDDLFWIGVASIGCGKDGLCQGQLRRPRDQRRTHRSSNRYGWAADLLQVQ